MKLKINDVAKLFNFTTEAVRFYEKENIIHVARESENNYRYYGVQHIKILSKCRFLRNAGFSIKESIDILSDGNINNISEILIKKELELKKEAERLSAISERIYNYRQKIEKIIFEENNFSIVNSPEILFFMNQHNDELLEEVDVIEKTSKLLKMMPFLNISILVKKNDLLKESIESSWSRYHGYSIDFSSLPKINIENETFSSCNSMIKMSSRKCIYTIQSFNLTKESKLNSIKLIKNYLEKNCYIVDGDMFGNQLFVDNEMHLSRKFPIGKVYYEYWIPIQ
ncbi:MerR family transcriptional regulator [Shewanella sp. ZOR0012]|uniref:helix-turn-helix domain-containing protein n=1 Tax=Shewanella sp. ZOR0012 TaxID=1339231 RepID=UPI000646DFA6|nr:MerR family transcriptional regulator [Shewanella sp. ZOR0012]NSM24599.1 MerR family transcriptional regulator [Shewanella sp. ZOR0012]